MTKEKKDGIKIFEELGFTRQEAIELDFRSELLSALIKVKKELKYSSKELATISGHKESYIKDMLKGEIDKVKSDDIVNILASINAEVAVTVSLPTAKVEIYSE